MRLTQAILAAQASAALAWGAPDFVNGDCLAPGGLFQSSSLTLDSGWPLVPGDLLVVSTGYLDAGVGPTVSDTLGNAFVEIREDRADPSGSFSGVSGAMYYAVIGDGGFDSITASWPGIQQQGEIFVQEYAGIPAPALVSRSSSHSQQLPIAITLSNAEPGDLVVAYGISNNHLALGDGGFTSRGSGTCNFDVAADTVATAQGPITATFLGPVGSGPVVAIIASFAGAAVSGGCDAGSCDGGSTPSATDGGLAAYVGCASNPAAPGMEVIAVLLAFSVLLAARRR